MKNRQQQFTTAASAVISLLVVVYLAFWTDWQAVRETISTLKVSWLLLAFVVFLINYGLRTYRFKMLLYTEQVSFLQMFPVVGLYGMANYLMPAKSGEISYPVLLKRRLQIALPESVSTLIVARFFDFATIALFLPAVLIAFWDDLPTWLSMSIITFSSIIYILAVAAKIWLRRPLVSTAQANIREGKSWYARASGSINNVLAGLRLIDENGNYWQLLLLTISIWICVYTYFYFILLSMNYDIGYIQMIIVSIIMVPLSLLPFQGVANLGTQEVGWVIAFRLFGYSEKVALNVAVGSHFVLLLFVLLLGAGSILVGRITNEKTG